MLAEFGMKPKNLCTHSLVRTTYYVKYAQKKLDNCQRPWPRLSAVEVQYQEMCAKRNVTSVSKMSSCCDAIWEVVNNYKWFIKLLLTLPWSDEYSKIKNHLSICLSISLNCFKHFLRSKQLVQTSVAWGHSRAWQWKLNLQAYFYFYFQTVDI